VLGELNIAGGIAVLYTARRDFRLISSSLSFARQNRFGRRELRGDGSLSPFTKAMPAALAQMRAETLRRKMDLC
jgi:hypothetical protein